MKLSQKAKMLRGRAKKAKSRSAKRSLLAKARQIESRTKKAKRTARKGTPKKQAVHRARRAAPARARPHRRAKAGKKKTPAASPRRKLRLKLAQLERAAASARAAGSNHEANAFELAASRIRKKLGLQENPMKRRRKSGARRRHVAKKNPMHKKKGARRRRSHKRNPTSAMVLHRAQAKKRSRKGHRSSKRRSASRSGRGPVHVISNVRITGPSSVRSRRSKRLASSASGSKRSRRIAKKALRTRRKPRLVRSSTSWRAPGGRSIATVSRFYPHHNPAVDATPMHLILTALSLGAGLAAVDFMDRRIAVMTPANGKHPWIGPDAVLRQMEKPGLARMGAQFGFGVFFTLVAKMLATRSQAGAFAAGGAALAGFAYFVLNGWRWYLAPKILTVTAGNEISLANETYVIEQDAPQKAISTIVADQDKNAASQPGQVQDKDAKGNPIVTAYDYATASPIPIVVVAGAKTTTQSSTRRFAGQHEQQKQNQAQARNFGAPSQGTACPQCGKQIGFGCGCRGGGANRQAAGKDFTVPAGMMAEIVTGADGRQVIQVRPAGAPRMMAGEKEDAPPPPQRQPERALPEKQEVLDFPRGGRREEGARRRPFA